MPPELHVPGPAWARVATDLVGVAGLVSFVAAFWWGWVVVALFALVLLGVAVPRIARLPGALQSVSGATLILGAWAATLDWYVAVPALDLVVHALANGLLAAVLVLAMVRSRLLPHALPRVTTVLLTASVGALLAVLWEAGEWLGHTWLDDAIGVGYDDTVGDLMSGTLGSAATGLALAMTGRSRSD